MKLVYVKTVINAKDNSSNILVQFYLSVIFAVYDFEFINDILIGPQNFEPLSFKLYTEWVNTDSKDFLYIWILVLDETCSNPCCGVHSIFLGYVVSHWGHFVCKFLGSFRSVVCDKINILVTGGLKPFNNFESFSNLIVATPDHAITIEHKVVVRVSELLYVCKSRTQALIYHLL